MKRVSPVTLITQTLVLYIPTEAIRGFLSKFKGKAEEVTAGLADIHLDDTIPSEDAGLKYMKQLVSYDRPPASHPFN